MEKSEFIENLRNEALEGARRERKFEQFTILLTVVTAIFVAICVLGLLFFPESFNPWSTTKLSPSLSSIILTSSILIVVICTVGGIVFPFGKATKERVDEIFKSLVAIRIERKTQYLSEIKSEMVELEEELEILKEL